MRFAQITIIVGIWLTSALTKANDDPARFWISISPTSPNVGQAPIVNAAVGRTQTLYIWATPATDSAGAFRAIEDFSLDIVTQTASSPFEPEPEPFIDFVDSTFKVYNDEVPGLPKRFQNKSDSSTPEAQGGQLTSEKSEARVLDFDEADAIKGLQGLSPTSSVGVVGIGNSGDPAPYHVGNAWRVGEFAFKTLPPDQGKTTVNWLFLQVGYAGIVSHGAGDTYLWFGSDTTPSAKYDATCPVANGCASQRQRTLDDDTFDVQIAAVPFSPGDYNGDGAINSADYGHWRSTLGQTVAVPGDGANGNGNGVVDSGDYVFWRKKTVSGGGTGAAMVNPNTMVPEPGTLALASILVVTASFCCGRGPKRSGSPA